MCLVDFAWPVLPPLTLAGLYEDFARDAAALPVVAGRLPASASLPGAATSYTLQAVVGGGRTLEVRG